MTSGYKILELGSITDFAWDSVYSVSDNSGYDTDALISYTIGFEWHGEPIPNLCTRLLFVRQKEVIAYVDCNIDETTKPEEWPLPIQMHMCSAQAHGISKKQAKFAVFRTCAYGFISYQMVPLACLDNFKGILKQGCADLSVQVVTDSLYQLKK